MLVTHHGVLSWLHFVSLSRALRALLLKARPKPYLEEARCIATVGDVTEKSITIKEL